MPPALSTCRWDLAFRFGHSLDFGATSTLHLESPSISDPSDLHIFFIGQEAWNFTPNLSMHSGCWPWRRPPLGAISAPHPLADEHLCICLIVSFFFPMQKNKPTNIEIFLALYGEMTLCQSLPTILKWSHIKCPLPWALVGQTWPQIWPFLGLWRQSHLHPSPWIWITFYFRPSLIWTS